MSASAPYDRFHLFVPDSSSSVAYFPTKIAPYVERPTSFCARNTLKFVAGATCVLDASSAWSVWMLRNPTFQPPASFPLSRLPAMMSIGRPDAESEHEHLVLRRWGGAGDVRVGVRRRFHRLLDGSGLDEERARAWAVVRVVRQATRDPANVTTYVAIAKAIQE